MSATESFVEKLTKRADIGDNFVYKRYTPPRDAAFADPPASLHPKLKERFRKLNVKKLYSHQAAAIEKSLADEDVIIATPTSSGKTFCFSAPVAHELLNDPEATALFLYPLKALARDQISSFNEFTEGLEPSITSEIYDGDVRPHVRRKIMANLPRALFTNPDMLHLSILSYHAKWENFFKRLKVVVIDEAHTYRGVFGSHVTQVLRRLLRICDYYGASPKFILSSATIANPGEFANQLTGRNFSVIEENGAPKSGQHFLVYNTEGSPYTDAARLFRAAINDGLKTITFTKARKITELIYRWTIQSDPELVEKVGAYRAGFLPEERRKIERDLFEGRMDGVVSTSALEMGVDIGGLDVCILVGYPGTIINTWQRAGRVGRAEKESLVILVAQPDALDQYFVKRPDQLFERGYEQAAIDPDNRDIVKAHLVCAAAEAPLAPDDKYFTPDKKPEAVTELLNEKKLVESLDSGCYLSTRLRPHRFVDIRSVGDTYTLFGADGKTVVGTQSGSRVFKEAHEGAVYLHMGRQYMVSRLDLEKKAAHVTPMDERYYTRARSDKETEILEVINEKDVNGYSVKLGRLKVTEQVTGFEKRSLFGQESLGVFDLDLPPTMFETVGFWIEIDSGIEDDLEDKGLGCMGGLHAVEHGAIALFPLFALCDRDDIGGIAYNYYPPLGHAAVFIYDGYPGGVGLCEAGFTKVEKLFDATLALLAECDCEEGCPSCIHSPKCGSGNRPLDKEAAVKILLDLTGKSKKRSRKAVIKKSSPVKEKPPLTETHEVKDMSEQNYYNPAPDRRILFFDLETQRSAAEVGGWGNTHMMRLAVGVIYDSIEKEYIRYWEKEADALIEKMLSADLVIGFNHVKFDYSVMSAYTDINLREQIKSFDMLQDTWNRLGHRLSLAALATTTLGRSKSADGLQSLVWWADGEYEKVADYCQVDVEVTKELFEYGLSENHLLYTHKSGERVKIANDWDLGKIISQASEGVKPQKRKIKF